MRSRNTGANGTVANASVRGDPDEKSTSAASAPSRLVPDISPTKKSGTLLEAGGRRGGNARDGRARLRGHLHEVVLEPVRYRFRLGKGHAHGILMHSADLVLVVQ